MAYTMDVLRLLPTFEVGIAMLGATGAVVKPRRAIGMQAALGADYLARAPLQRRRNRRVHLRAIRSDFERLDRQRGSPGLRFFGARLLDSALGRQHSRPLAVPTDDDGVRAPGPRLSASCGVRAGRFESVFPRSRRTS